MLYKPLLRAYSVLCFQNENVEQDLLGILPTTELGIDYSRETHEVDTAYWAAFKASHKQDSYSNIRYT